MLLDYLWEMFNNIWKNVEKCWETQLSIYAHKNHVLLIFDNISYEGNLSFLHKTQAVECLWFKLPLWRNVFIVLRDSYVKTMIQRQSVLTIGMRNLFTVTLHEYCGCTRMSSYKCFCMIFIIQSEFTNLW